MEASSVGLAEGRMDMVDFDIAVRTRGQSLIIQPPPTSISTRATDHLILIRHLRIQVYTNLDHERFDGHETLEASREAKARLFEALTDAARQRAVVNVDDAEAQFFMDKVGAGVPVITYSTKTPNDLDPSQPLPDVYPTVIDLSLFDSVLEISTPAGDLQVTSMLLGMPNVANVCAAVAVGCALGISLDVITDGAPRGDCRNPSLSHSSGPTSHLLPPPQDAALCRTSFRRSCAMYHHRAGIQSLENGVPGRLEMVDENQPFAVIVGERLVITEQTSLARCAAALVVPRRSQCASLNASCLCSLRADNASTPESLKRTLQTVRDCGAQRIVTIFGCNGEECASIILLAHATSVDNQSSRDATGEALLSCLSMRYPVCSAGTPPTDLAWGRLRTS